MFNIYLTLNYGIAATVKNVDNKDVRIRYGDEVLISRTLYNKYKTEMCSAQVTISNKKIVAKIPRYMFRFENVGRGNKKILTDDKIQ
jgi:hypothetical protein